MVLIKGKGKRREKEGRGGQPGGRKRQGQRPNKAYLFLDKENY